MASGEIANAPTATMNPFDLNKDYSRSAFDQRQTFVLDSQYEMPWDSLLKGRFTKTVFGGWAINGIFSAGSGLPENLSLSFNNSQDNDTEFVDRPNLAPGFTNIPINGVTAGCQGVPTGQKLGTPTRWFDPCAFLLPPAGTFGNVGRMALQGPDLFDVDFTLLKNTHVSERINLEFRTEFFNLLNHTNFGFPAAVLFNSSGLHSGNEGQITNTSTPNREIQFGMKLLF